MNFWVLTGSLENWDRGISDSIWGCREGLKPRWENLETGDVLIFYVSSPISGIIGTGVVTSRFKANSPLWPDEVRENKIIYTYRFEFKIEYVLPKPDWKQKSIKIKDLNVPFQAGLNSFTNKDAVKTLFGRIDLQWNTELGEKVEVEAPKPKEKPANLHDEIKKKLKEIGEMKGFISENEYPVDGQRLDCVWRSAGVSGAVPKFVFEVQIGGSVTEALGKLKHAYDKWGFPKLFLIAEEKDRSKINQLLAGTFHEIKDMLKIVPVEKIEKFYEIQKKDEELKREIGF
jgi:hypothetical protein